MSSFQVLEILIICLIIALQCYVFYSTYNKIKSFKEIFPDVDCYEVFNLNLKPHYFKLHPSEILDKMFLFIGDSQPKVIPTVIGKNEDNTLIRSKLTEKDTREATDIIMLKSGGNQITQKVINTLNTYLLRNRSIAADFLLMKDIVERNTDVAENEVQQTISLPLYLGLLGTFIGIVMGLIQISGMDFQTGSDSFDSAISTLLNGVLIAMVASFLGLLLTIANSGFYFKNAKSHLEDKKNDFYTFLQIDLMPLLNQGVNSTLYSLQNNLHKFNNDFNANLVKLNSVMGKNHDALIAQEKILSTLENIDINEFAKANVKILKELKLSTEMFSEFNEYLSQVNLLNNSAKLHADRVNEMIARTDNFNELGKQILSSFTLNKQILEFLQGHYNSLDESHQLITNSVNTVNNTLEESLEQLKEFTQERISELQKITLKELDLMQNQYPEKWKKLDNLSHLESLSKNISDIKMSNASQISSISLELKNINSVLKDTLKEVAFIKENRKNIFGERITSTFKKVFKRK